MKVNGSTPGGMVGPAAGKARAADGGFALPSSAATSGSAAVARTTGPSGVSSVDALLALQEAGGPLERRRRAVRRAGKLLDHLDSVKLAILESGPTDGALDQLAAAIREARDETSDPGLDSVLNEIETRAAVELAKREVAQRAS